MRICVEFLLSGPPVVAVLPVLEDGGEGSGIDAISEIGILQSWYNSRSERQSGLKVIHILNWKDFILIN